MEITVDKPGLFFVRTGPDGQHQSLEISSDGNVIQTIENKVFSDWEAIQINPDNVDGTLKVTITDDGTGWGQWIAVAYRQ